MCCSVLQCVAVCCSVLQCVTCVFSEDAAIHTQVTTCNELQHTENTSIHMMCMRECSTCVTQLTATYCKILCNNKNHSALWTRIQNNKYTATRWTRIKNSKHTAIHLKNQKHTAARWKRIKNSRNAATNWCVFIVLQCVYDFYALCLLSKIANALQQIEHAPIRGNCFQQIEHEFAAIYLPVSVFVSISFISSICCNFSSIFNTNTQKKICLCLCLCLFQLLHEDAAINFNKLK